MKAIQVSWVQSWSGQPVEDGVQSRVPWHDWVWAAHTQPPAASTSEPRGLTKMQVMPYEVARARPN